MFNEIMRARQTELHVAETTITHRMTWEQLSRVDRLERALKKARGRLQILPNLAPKAH